jgi:formylglycine-generating enzyme required for sulfatase activity
MIKVPGGDFVMGGPEIYGDERLKHNVYVSAFYIDRYEITNSEYVKFLNENFRFKLNKTRKFINLDSPYSLIKYSGNGSSYYVKNRQTDYETRQEEDNDADTRRQEGEDENTQNNGEDTTNTDNNSDNQNENNNNTRRQEGDEDDSLAEIQDDATYDDYGRYPVVVVTWYGAKAYADWVGKQLPTEAEWEFAASVGGNYAYPWGNEWITDKSNNNELDNEELLNLISNFYEDGSGVLPVGKFEANEFGLYDIAGNVAEWTADFYNPEFYGVSPERNPISTEGVYRVKRGGSFSNGDEFLKTYHRDWALPDLALNDLGFRLVCVDEERVYGEQITDTGDTGDDEDDGEDQSDTGDDEDDGEDQSDAGDDEDDGEDQSDAGDDEDDGEDQSDAGDDEDEDIEIMDNPTAANGTWTFEMLNENDDINYSGTFNIDIEERNSSFYVTNLVFDLGDERYIQLDEYELETWIDDDGNTYWGFENVQGMLVGEEGESLSVEDTGIIPIFISTDETEETNYFIFYGYFNEDFTQIILPQDDLDYGQYSIGETDIWLKWYANK